MLASFLARAFPTISVHRSSNTFIADTRNLSALFVDHPHTTYETHKKLTIMQTKHRLHLTAALLLTLGFAGCNQSADSLDAQPDYRITLSASELRFAQAGGTQSITVAASDDVAWRIDDPQAYDWCTVAADGTTVTFTVGENPAYDPRTAAYTFTNGHESALLTVQQAESEGFFADERYEVGSEAGELEVAVETNVAYTIRTDAAWIRYAETRALHRETVVFAVEQNPGIYPRTARIDFTDADDNTLKIISVTQGGGNPDIPFTLSPDALDVTAAGGSETVEVVFAAEGITFAIDYVNPDDETWCTFDAEESRIVFHVTANDAYDPREAEFTVSWKDYTTPFTVRQAQTDAFQLTERAYRIDHTGGELPIDVRTNTDYTLAIPDEARSWISVKPQTRALRDERIVLQIEPHHGFERMAEIAVLDAGGQPLSTLTVTQQTDMASAFPDPIFRSYLLEIFDTDYDECLSQAEAEAVTRIAVSSKEIQSMQGVKHFPNLVELHCNSNQLTTLDVSNLTDLAYLYCQSNRLTTLDISNTPALVRLDCYSNKLTELDASEHPVLGQLYCHNNQLAALHINNAYMLKTVWCQNNQLTTFDISDRPLLKEFRCYSNKLETLHVNNLPSIEILYCNDNRLTRLDASDLPTLTVLWCENNNITDLTVDFTALETLYCHSNQLTTLDLSHAPALAVVRCNGNLLTDLNVTDMPSLVQLICDRNQLTTLDVSTTNLNNYASYPQQIVPLNCYMSTLTTLILKQGWELPYITQDTSFGFIHANTQIRYAD